jgi:RimJ/RimL family protein N-acetyltransferase
MTKSSDNVLTRRLDLRPITVDDLDAVFTLMSDPRTWENEPQGRHVDRETTLGWIERAARRWGSDGLSYWIVRRRSTGQVVGVGGVQRRGDRSWNLFYRLAPSAWGNGYATELARAAILAARLVDSSVPVTAWIGDNNQPSRAAAVRLGLIDQGMSIDANDGVVRRFYADRELSLRF